MTHNPSDFDFCHLVGLCRALRLAQRGNLATGTKPNADEAQHLATALDAFISEHDRCESKEADDR